MNQKAINVFSYLRGALRGSYGKESFHNKKILIVGTCSEGQELIEALTAFDLGKVFFQPAGKNRFSAYSQILIKCPSASVWKGEKVDIEVNIPTNSLRVGKKERSFKDLTSDFYNEGIHAFYL